ncbi:PepSY domain-containing protein [Phenylobacterium sp.]|uniref:PepSY domain-containing protein n=1 Tax=Phenylobacterium sp. TaxID=1871053 RepID=UPI0035635FD1
MPPIATASDANPPARPRRTAWAPRWLVVTHRYLGVVLGALMLLWCLSGAVMLFVPYPSVSQDERLARLPRIDWSHCCVIAGAAPADAAVRAATIEQLAEGPVLRLRLADGSRRLIDLSNGHVLNGATRAEALVVAEAWGRPSSVASVVRDQWTVSGEFNRGRPFWRVRLADQAASDIYVSQTSGEVVQRTTGASRALNWLGAVPHWLYPTLLRQNVKLWTQVVIWTSLAGVFLTVAGLYLGLMAWRPFGDKRLSPFRGLMTWHHLTGLATGILTLTWAASGLVSMNPWGFLESPDDPAPGRIAGPPPAFAEVQGALESAAAHAPAVAQVRLIPFDGRAFVLAGDTRLGPTGRPAPASAADLAAAGRRLGAVAAQGLLTHEDAYYFSHHEAVTLPVWRVLMADGRRYYLDPRSGAPVAAIDAQAKGYRWLHEGLHRFDFVPGFRRGAAWAAVTLVLLSLVTFGVGTGVWLGWRRIGLDLAQFRAPSRPR